ncbi:MAG: hypothetical protein A2X12_09255 [Bacteroidetes bacterium GWE2_29_8]|nr:MAG: hypothetical protein A2X12_09255 [Bacteroidetes bacterium GWE2_29_8]OFY18063.1 MAG: hypothetical protein A2X02_05775 [Bacteroidetes bacterium GWF2_29_10]
MTKKQLKIIFIVQGEGRGHITQAISMKEIIEQNGHQVVSVLVGTSEKREIPDFFVKEMNVEIKKIASPNFVTDIKYKSIRIIPSIVYNLTKIPTFLNDLKIIKKEIKKHNPDLIINFYEPLMGLYNMFYRNRIPVISIAHQFIYQHEDFIFPKSKWFDKFSVKLVTYVAGYKSTKKLAISFYNLKPSSNKKIIVVPPLLRKGVFNTNTGNENFILIYLLNPGYAEEIINWHKENPNVKINCFWDKKEIQEEYIYDDNLVFYKINDKKFIEKLSSCKGFMTTAGFESVCEAVYHNKPVFMVPVQNHFEQYCNSRDAMNINAGLYDTQFDISKFLEYINNNSFQNKKFKDWTDSSQIIFEKILFSYSQNTQ